MIIVSCELNIIAQRVRHGTHGRETQKDAEKAKEHEIRAKTTKKIHFQAWRRFSSRSLQVNKKYAWV